MADFNHRLIEDAVKLMGRQHVAKALEVPEETLDAWLRGEGHIAASDLTRLARAAVDFAQNS